MAHFFKPGKSRRERSTIFARPAIIGLSRLMKESGSLTQNLVASLHGAASNKFAPGYKEGLAQQNIQTAREVLDTLGIQIDSLDIGGSSGRKVAFHSATGECVVVKTDKIRIEDWYPGAP